MPPNPTIKSISKTKISDEPGMNVSLVTVTFDVPIQAYTFNLLGISQDTGTVVDSNSRYIRDIKSQSVSNVKLRTVRDIRAIEANTDIVATIDWNELYQEGENRINVYGKDLEGNWTVWNS